MENRTEEPPRLDSNITDWVTNIPTVTESTHTGLSFCVIVSYTMLFLSLVIGLVGLLGNAIVLWFLGSPHAQECLLCLRPQPGCS
ncbi:hypothetical protein STEG23_032318 [Scotinomys teguina]